MSSIRNARRLTLLAGAALAIQSGAALAQDQTTNVSNASQVTANAPAGTTHTVNISGRVGPFIGSGSSIDVVSLTGQGAGHVVINASGDVAGRLDFSDLSGGVDVNIDDLWAITGTSDLGAGDDVVTLGSAAEFRVSTASTGGSTGSGSTALLEDPVVIRFNGGADSFTNNGTVAVGARWQTNQSATGLDILESELRFEGLETFDNAGLIMLGTALRDLDVGTDLQPDDVLLLPGAAFTGSGDSRIVFDVALNRSQSACDTSLRDAETFAMPAADCVGIQGGSTAGETRLIVNDVLAGDRGGNIRVVLVDVGGGDSAAEHFVLDPSSDNYSDAFGGVIDKGFFLYPLIYDEDAQQHLLVGMPGGNALQYPLLAQAGHALWRQSTGTWFDRQADLRGDIDDGIGGGMWLRASGEQSERDVAQASEALGSTFAFDNTFEQVSYAVSGGFDLLSGSGGDTAYVVGLMAGYVNSQIEFDANPNVAQFDGFSGGGYASFVSGPLFIDASVNANKLTLDHDVPALALSPVGTITSTRLLTVGAQAEAGWRFALSGGAFVEPLASLSYARTTFDDLQIASDDRSRVGVSVEWDDPASLRGGLGARLGLDQDYGGVRAQYSVLGRVWNEFEDGADVLLHNVGEDFAVGQDFTGQFSELTLGASVWGMDGAVSGFVNLGGKWGDGYQATNASAGVRVSW